MVTSKYAYAFGHHLNCLTVSVLMQTCHKEIEHTGWHKKLEPKLQQFGLLSPDKRAVKLPWNSADWSEFGLVEER